MTSTPTLIIGSISACSGKSASILGLTPLLQQRGCNVSYGKLLHQESDEELEDSIDSGVTWSRESDLSFFQQALNLPNDHLQFPLITITSEMIFDRLQGQDQISYLDRLSELVQSLPGDFKLLEGSATLWEGDLFDLSLLSIAERLNASVLLVIRYNALESIEQVLCAKRQLGNHLIGVILNHIPSEQWQSAQTVIQPALEKRGIPVFGLLPENNLLRSVPVRKIARLLKAKVLCRKDRLDLMVENLTIGAMNVNSALEYFRQRRNMAVVTGGDRTDLQMAALETSTHCLILTGHTPPQPLILSRAEDLEIPILAVDLDTLSTIEIIDRTFGEVPLQEMIKVHCIQDLMKENFQVDRLFQTLNKGK